jgi:hypothetical protein
MSRLPISSGQSLLRTTTMRLTFEQIQQAGSPLQISILFRDRRIKLPLITYQLLFAHQETVLRTRMLSSCSPMELILTEGSYAPHSIQTQTKSCTGIGIPVSHQKNTVLSIRQLPKGTLFSSMTA